MSNKLPHRIYFRLMVVLLSATIAASCKKTSSNNASVLLYNGSWSTAAVTAAWNSNNIIVTPIVQGQSSGTANAPYIEVPAGTNLVTLKAGSDTLISKNIYTSSAGGSSILFYDTSAAAGTKLNILQLTDDPVLPDTAQIKYRFINLSPDTAVVADLWLVNGATDSVQLGTGAGFIGKNALASSVQTFTAIRYHGETYSIKVKKTGTEDLYISLPDYVFTVKGVYSIIFSGLSGGTGSAGFKLSLLRHFAP